MRCFAGSCRVVFNEALALQKARYEASEKKLGYAGLCKALTEWKGGAVLPSGRLALWLNESPSQTLQQTLKDLERAYRNFFEKRADFPRFKKRGVRDSFRFPQGVKLEQGNARIFLPKLGWLRYRKSREALGVVKNAAVSLSAGKWFVSIQTEREVPDPVPESTTAVGIDLGLTRFATSRTGRSTRLCPVSRSMNSGLPVINGQCPGRSNSATTGRRRRPESRRFTSASVTRGGTTCTNARPRSAKTTRWCASRICG